MQYNNEYHRTKFAKFIDNPTLWMLRGELAKKNFFGDDFNENNNVLEFGCGVGFNLACIKNAWGYDINKELYPMLNSKGIKTFDNIDEMPNDFFDDILICMCLEHLPNPIETINLLKLKLKQGGRMRIVLPKINYSLKNRGGLNESIDGHTFAWTFYEINYLMNYCGFTNTLNKKIFRRGMEFFYFKGLRGKLYHFCVYLLGRFINDFDIMVISKK